MALSSPELEPRSIWCHLRNQTALESHDPFHDMPNLRMIRCFRWLMPLGSDRLARHGGEQQKVDEGRPERPGSP